MSVLTVDRIKLQGQALDKVDAIRQAGQLLVNSGCVDPEYIDGMLAREETMSTYLGNGVAIPHGTYDHLQHIHQAGISVLQVKDGVVWEEGESAYLIIGIAATSDEHIGILSNLAEAVEDEAIAAQLAQTADPDLILTYLNKQPELDS